MNNLVQVLWFFDLFQSKYMANYGKKCIALLACKEMKWRQVLWSGVVFAHTCTNTSKGQPLNRSMISHSSSTLYREHMLREWFNSKVLRKIIKSRSLQKVFVFMVLQLILMSSECEYSRKLNCKSADQSRRKCSLKKL